MHADMTYPNDCVHPLLGSLLNHRVIQPPPPPSLCDSVKCTEQRWAACRTGEEQPPVGMCARNYVCVCLHLFEFSLSLIWVLNCNKRIVSERSQSHLWAANWPLLLGKERVGRGSKGIMGGLVVRCADRFMSHHPNCSAHRSSAGMCDRSCKRINPNHKKSQTH